MRLTRKQLDLAAVKMRDLLDVPSLDDKDMPPAHELVEVEPGWFSNGRMIAPKKVWDDLFEDVRKLEAGEEL